MSALAVASALVTAGAIYLGAGLAVGAAFAIGGAGTVLPHAGPVSWGARLLIVPGAALLWPYVLARWLGARRRGRAA